MVTIGYVQQFVEAMSYLSHTSVTFNKPVSREMSTSLLCSKSAQSSSYAPKLFPVDRLTGLKLKLKGPTRNFY